MTCVLVLFRNHDVNHNFANTWEVDDMITILLYFTSHSSLCHIHSNITGRLTSGAGRDRNRLGAVLHSPGRPKSRRLVESLVLQPHTELFPDGITAARILE